MAPILGLHTTSRGCHVAVLGDEATAPGMRFAATAPQASSALPALAQQVLALAGVRLTELCGIAVACGPGSFTGIKIGLASAWGLGRPARVPVIGVGSLDALALAGRLSAPAVIGAPARVVAVCGAYAGLVYAARFHPGSEPEDLVLDGEYRVGKPAELLPELIGDGASVVLEGTPLAEVAGAVLESFAPVRVEPGGVFAEAVARLARHREAKCLRRETSALYLRADPAKAW